MAENRVTTTIRPRIRETFTWNIEDKTLLNRKFVSGPYIVKTVNGSRVWTWYIQMSPESTRFSNTTELDFSVQFWEKNYEFERDRFDCSYEVILGDPVSTVSKKTRDVNVKDCQPTIYDDGRLMAHRNPIGCVKFPLTDVSGNIRNGTLQVTVNLLMMLGPVSTVPEANLEATHILQWQSNFFSNLYNNESNSDIVFQCENKTFWGHKIILEQCPVFAAMFRTEMKEGITNEIIISDVSPEVLEMLLKSLYGLPIVVPSQAEKLLQLLDSAEKYDVPLLKLQCFMEMKRLLSLKTAGQFTIAAYKYFQQGEIDYFRSYCFKNMATLIKDPEFKQLYTSNLNAFI